MRSTKAARTLLRTLFYLFAFVSACPTSSAFSSEQAPSDRNATSGRPGSNAATATHCGVRVLASRHGDTWTFIVPAIGQEGAFDDDAPSSLQFVFDDASGADYQQMLDDVAFMVCEWL